MEIYNDILSAIERELPNGEAKPTRIQSLSNLAYDFLQDYDRIRDFVIEMGVKYLDISEREIYER
jgi:predicted transcriptional regulator